MRLYITMLNLVLTLLITQVDPCVDAQNHYKNLDIEKAVAIAAGASATSANALPLCLEVQALSHIVMGQVDRAIATLKTLFRYDPNYLIDDPTLSPSMRDVIASARSASAALKEQLSAAWISHHAIRLEIAFEGALPKKSRVRYTARFPQSGETQRAAVNLVGSVATATIVVLGEEELHTLEVNGIVRTSQGLTIHEFVKSVPLDFRPKLPVVRTEAWHQSWWFWTSVALAVVGGSTAATVYAVDKRTHDTSGTLGRMEIASQ